ncbi:cyclic nucleotide-binding domain-containing protein [Hydrogenophaga sp.]|uniref:cyclic nucleotide-binding domain-containing protein n=1 Tax=Hydrogenophaga sp. TaxID=1904254 RepID=UPI00261EDEDC|nr:cyclic nucleotide-binding domain-containing protein [Hydrogenophaga sp.]MCW5655950.1 cyclic nucleotide-binding domain-containing protein [Hydrogenophaga sp.]
MSSNSNVVRFFGSRRSCADCNLRKECAWREMDERLLEGLEATPELFRRGERLFHAGDALRSLFVVRAGAVKTCMVSSEGDEQIVAFHGPGELIGLDAVADGTYACDAVALDTSNVCAIPYEELCARAVRNAGLQQHLMRAMSCAIKRNGDMVMLLGKKNAEQRMASFLMARSDAQRNRGYSASEVTLPMSRADIGNYLSLAVETVCRQLTRMQADGLLEVHRSMVSIRDLSALRSLAGGETGETPARRAAL